MTKNYLKGIVVSPIYFICILVLYIGMIWGGYEVFLHETSISLQEVYFYSMRLSGFFTISLIVVSALPSSFIIVDEMKKGYYELISTRCSYIKYLLTRMIGSIASGMIMVLITFILFFVTILILNPDVHFEFTINNIRPIEPMKYYLYNTNKGLLMFWIYLLSNIIQAGVAPAIAVSFAAISKNKYIAIIGPYLVLATINVISSLAKIDLLNIQYMTIDNSENLLFGGIPFSLGYCSLIIFVFFMCSYLVLKRRHQNE